MPNKSNRIKLIFAIYWFFLAYILAALIWWFIALTQQNDQMTSFKIDRLQKDRTDFEMQYNNVLIEKDRKSKQYIGEGAIFLLLIVAGAIFLYRAVNKQLKISKQQQHFMMAVTHELKTPIAVTKLNLETLQKRKLDEEQQMRLINNTVHETNRMNALCNNLLLSSQFDAGGYKITKETILLSELVDTSVSDFIKRYPNRIFVNEIADDVYVHADTMLLEIVMNNLLDNAIKYSPKEGKIFTSLHSHNNTAIIRVADEGSGINADEKNKVFEKFYRSGSETNIKAKGTGLGLYLTERIIKAHEGKICIKDNQPKGSIFVIEIKQKA
jgi:K+-sensing histidine kinase KdpD